MKGKILVIGDDCTNVVRYGRVNKIIPHLNIPVLEDWGELVKPGLVSYIRDCLTKLGFEVTCIPADSITRFYFYDIESANTLPLALEKITTNPIDLENVPKVFKSFSAAVIVDYNKTLPPELFDLAIKNTYVLTNRQISCNGTIISESGINEGITFLGRQGATYLGNLITTDCTGNNNLNILELFTSVLVAANLASEIDLSIKMAVDAVSKELSRSIDASIMNWDDIMVLTKTYRINTGGNYGN